MNREQRRAAGKGQSDERIDVTGIVVHFANGQIVNLDTNKIQIVDKDTGRPLFQEVLELVPAQVNVDETVKVHQDTEGNTSIERETDTYAVQFDTPEGPMEYVKNGNWFYY